MSRYLDKKKSDFINIYIQQNKKSTNTKRIISIRIIMFRFDNNETVELSWCTGVGDLSYLRGGRDLCEELGSEPIYVGLDVDIGVIFD